MPIDVRQIVFSIQTDLSQIQSSLKTLEGNFSASLGRIQNVMRNVGGALGIGLGIGAIVGFGKSILNLAGQLQDLSDRTGISTQTLSGLKSTLEQSGVSLEQFAKGISFAQKNLGDVSGSGKEAAEALSQMGLNVNELVSASPDEFLDQFAQALAKVENHNERTALAVKVLGKAGAELVPVLVQNAAALKELREKGLSPENVKRLEELGDSLTEVYNQALLLGAEGAVALGKFFRIIELAPIEKLGKASIELERAQQRLEALKRHAPGDIGSIQAAEREIARLKTVEEEALKVANAPKKPKPDGGGDTPDKELQKKIERVTDSLRKQLVQLQAQKIGLDQGAEAALRFSLTQQALDELGIKPLPPEIKKLIDHLAAGTAQLEKIKSAAANAAAELASLAPTFREIDFVQESAIAGGQDLLGVLKSLEIEGMTPLEARLAAINAEFDKMRMSAFLAGEATGQSVEKILERLEFFRRQRILGAEPPTALDLRDTEEGDIFGSNISRESVEEMVKVFDRFAGAGLTGLRETLRGVMLNTSDLGEALENVWRNVAVSVAELIFELTVLEPILARIRASMTGQARRGTDFFDVLGGLVGPIVGGLAGGGGGFDFGSLGTSLDIMHGQHGFSGIVRRPTMFMTGEGFMPEHVDVTPMSKMGDKGGPSVSVVIRGGIIPERPGMTKDQIIQVSIQDIKDGGALRSTIIENTR